MRSFRIGRDIVTGRPIHIRRHAFRTHFHLIGGTGKGKTTALHTMLHPLLSDPLEKACFIIIDRLGNFALELLLWLSSVFCPARVRERLVYIQPAREDVVSTFNPLLVESSSQCYYRIERATEIILRAWESVNIEAMPRLARWIYNAFAAAAQLGLTIADCVHFLMPGSPYHAALLDLLPDRLAAEWSEITQSRGQEAIRILDSSRNRLRPYFDSDILRRMFGSIESRLDVLRLMREGRIVIVDLSPRNRLSPQLADTIGALLINEVLAVARSLPREVRYPTYLLLDEFQRFVGPDIENALPEVRQLGLRLILSHQSFSQLERGDYDLSTMIWQAQSRLVFGVQGEDADLLAHEVASLTFDPRKVKEEIWSRRQLASGHRIVELHSSSVSQGSQSGTTDTRTSSRSNARGRSGQAMYLHSDRAVQSESSTDGNADVRGRTESSSYQTSHGTSQHLVPQHEEFLELASRTFENFEEQKSVWAREIRRLPTGHALMRLVDDPTLYQVKVHRSAPGILGFDLQTLARHMPAALERMDRMVEENFRSDFFVPAAEVDRLSQVRLREVLASRIVLPTTVPVESDASGPDGEKPRFGI